MNSIELTSENAAIFRQQTFIELVRTKKIMKLLIEIVNILKKIYFLIILFFSYQDPETP